MNKQMIIESLQKKAKENKVFYDFLHVCSVRDRARCVVTLSGLSQRMKKEGYAYPDTEYAPVLKFLADLGLGRLEKNGYGRVKALRDVKMTLQSIGEAGIGKSKTLKAFKQRNKFMKLFEGPSEVVAKPKQEERRQIPTQVILPQAKLIVSINGKPVTIQVPSNLTEQEIAALIGRFQDRRQRAPESPNQEERTLSA
jgi:hypothetical protein